MKEKYRIINKLNIDLQNPKGALNNFCGGVGVEAASLYTTGKSKSPRVASHRHFLVLRRQSGMTVPKRRLFVVPRGANTGQDREIGKSMNREKEKCAIMIDLSSAASATI